MFEELRDDGLLWPFGYLRSKGFASVGNFNVALVVSPRLKKKSQAVFWTKLQEGSVPFPTKEECQKSRFHVLTDSWVGEARGPSPSAFRSRPQRGHPPRRPGSRKATVAAPAPRRLRSPPAAAGASSVPFPSTSSVASVLPRFVSATPSDSFHESLMPVQTKTHVGNVQIK